MPRKGGFESRSVAEVIAWQVDLAERRAAVTDYYSRRWLQVS
jgi:hypothetical protein